jgi:hypothetical protein
VRADNGWLLRDLGSLNGTRLNGARSRRTLCCRTATSWRSADWSLAYRDAEVPSDPDASVAEARLRDVTDLATRSYVEPRRCAPEPDPELLTRAAAAVVVDAPSAPELLDTLLGHVLEAVRAAAGPSRSLEGDPMRYGGGAARATEGRGGVDDRPRLARARTCAPRPPSWRRASRAATQRCAPCCAPLLVRRRCAELQRAAAAWCSRAGGETPFDEEHLKLVNAVATCARAGLESLSCASRTRTSGGSRGPARAARISSTACCRTRPRSSRATSSPQQPASAAAVGADYYDFVSDGVDL